jgi:hypothetical protein
MTSYEAAKAEAISQSHRRWERVRARGRRRYIWTRGVLGWGGLMTLGFCLGNWLNDGFDFAPAAATTGLCAAGGYFMGVVKWKHNEEAYLTGKNEEIS